MFGGWSGESVVWVMVVVVVGLRGCVGGGVVMLYGYSYGGGGCCCVVE